MANKRENYVTDRLRTLHKADLNDSFTKTIDRIAEFGLEVWSIKEGAVSPAFSYSVGIYETSGQPEIVTVGLHVGTAHRAINEAAKLLRDGVDLTVGRHQNLVGQVDVEFRPVDPQWLHQIMLRADWLYDGRNVPVLQLIYPDLENVFPGEDGFNEHFAQPDLSCAPPGKESLASDLWYAYDKSSVLSRWKFATGPHTAAFIAETVHQGVEPVVFVSHDRGGDWQFLGNSMRDGGGPVLACLHHPIEDDTSLEELYDLPEGWYAERHTPADPWRRYELPPEEQDETAETPLIN